MKNKSKKSAALWATFIALGLLGGLSACSGDSLTGVDKGDSDTPNYDGPCVTSAECGPDAWCDDGTCVAVCPFPPCDGDDGDDGSGGDVGGDTGGDGDLPGDGSDDPSVDPGDGGGCSGCNPEIWVDGDWDSEYHMDWSEYMGPLAGLGSELDFLDQLFMGNTDIQDLPFVGAALQDFVDDSIPGWLQEVIHTLNNLVHFFQDVRIDAALHLYQSEANPFRIHAEEEWETGYVMLIDQCAYGENDPTYPECALVPIPLNRFVAEFGTIETVSPPFIGELIGRDIYFEEREVEMEMSRFVLYVINRSIDYATDGEYHTLDDALTASVDCVQVTTSVEDAMCNTFGSCGGQSWVEPICVVSRDAVITTIENRLLAVAVDWEVMTFSQDAEAVDVNHDGRADLLGLPPAQPGRITDGEFEFVRDIDLTGNWSATRP